MESAEPAFREARVVAPLPCVAVNASTETALTNQNATAADEIFILSLFVDQTSLLDDAMAKIMRAFASSNLRRRLVCFVSASSA